MSALPLSVLLVEDSDDDALLVLEHLRQGGYDLTWQRVMTADAMVSALRDRVWDVIISDHNLPRFSGTEALELTLRSDCDAPFIIVSGTIGEEMAVAAMKSGASDFVMKRSLGKLVPAVANAVQAAAARRMHAAAQAEVRESREQLRRLSSHLETVREKERARIAREIHDELGGILTAIKMDIGWLSRRIGELPEVSQKLQSMTELSDGAIKTMRRIITDLRPSVLDDLGLIAAIEWQLREFQNRMGIRTALALGLEPAVNELEFDPRIAVTTFRILQESLSNIAKHAGATRVMVQVSVTDGQLVVEIRDNGCGIDLAQPRRADAYGLLGMHERALHLGGTLSVTGMAGQGTGIILSLPLDPLEGERE